MSDKSAGRNRLETSIHTSAHSRARLAKRYRAEARFRTYGLCAVGFALTILIFLLVTIMVRALPVFTHHYVVLPLNLIPPSVNAERPASSDFRAVIRSALKEIFPNVTKRKEKRALSGTLASGADILLRDEIVAAPEPIGGTYEYGLPLSDDADLYLKGVASSQKTLRSNEPLNIRIEGDQIRLAAVGAFAEILAEKKRKSQRQIDELLKARQLQEAGLGQWSQKLQGLDETLLTARDADREWLMRERENAKKALSFAEGKIEKLQRQIEQLQRSASVQEKPETLSQDDPSALIHSGLLYIKLHEVGRDVAFGKRLFQEADGEALQLIDDGDQVTIAPEQWAMTILERPENSRKISDLEIAYLEAMRQLGLIENRLNRLFFTSGASREPERAGIWGAIVGSFFTMLVTLATAFPIGVCTAIYLEEFAPKNRFTQLIEVNINNLAAVPSIVFGLLGLAVFLNVFGMPRSAPLVGGLVLGLMTLPTIIIAARAAIRAVPPSVREAALGVGASHMQCVFHHVLPLAMPGIFTGSIIGMAQALGETAPLLMIGMVAFIVDIPSGPLDPATVLPVQIYMWADFPETAFSFKTSAAILVLLVFLITMNATAVFLRRRAERKW